MRSTSRQVPTTKAMAMPKSATVLTVLPSSALPFATAKCGRRKSIAVARHTCAKPKAVPSTNRYAA